MPRIFHMSRATRADFAAAIPAIEAAITAALKLRHPSERAEALENLVYSGRREQRYLVTQLIIARLSGFAPCSDGVPAPAAPDPPPHPRLPPAAVAQKERAA
jgi:hypothetical protein